MSAERRVKILCAEDERDIRENIADILRDEGFEVFEAENGKIAFESFVKNKPDLIISDIMMPEVDGYGLLKLVRESKNSRGNNIPFIFLTALGQKDDVIKGVKLSANDYLVKPIEFDLMIAKVKEKTINAIKVQAIQDKNISNIKDQVKSFLPADLLNYVDIISNVSSILKEEPYGPLPHRRYIDDFEKIYINTAKIRSVIANAFDESVIDHKLSTDEEIVDIVEFLGQFIDGLSEKFRSKINLEPLVSEEFITKVKMDKIALLDSMRKIFAGLFKSDPQSRINISLIMDHLDQMVVIFYVELPENRQVDLRASLEESEIKDILSNQSCQFEIVKEKINTATLVVPSYRLIS